MKPDQKRIRIEVSDIIGAGTNADGSIAGLELRINDTEIIELAFSTDQIVKAIYWFLVAQKKALETSETTGTVRSLPAFPTFGVAIGPSAKGESTIFQFSLENDIPLTLSLPTSRLKSVKQHIDEYIQVLEDPNSTVSKWVNQKEN